MPSIQADFPTIQPSKVVIKKAPNLPPKQAKINSDLLKAEEEEENKATDSSQILDKQDPKSPDGNSFLIKID